MTDIADLSTAVTALITQYGLTRDEFADLMAGAADGGPASNGYYPITKADGSGVVQVPSPLKINALATRLAFGAINVSYATRALLNADLNWDAGKIGFVTNDATAANNDFYIKVGAAGVGSWTLTTIIHDAITSAAAASVAAAATSATNAATSATAASGSATAATTSATNAASSASGAATSATAAAGSATAATTSATNAAISASAASTSATAASGSATGAATSASGAATSATNAGTSATAAAGSATAAATSATNAASSASGAATSAATAAASAATSANTLASLTGDILTERTAHPQFSGEAGNPSQNADGSWNMIGGGGGGWSISYNAAGPLAVGEFVNFAVKVKTGSLTGTLPFVRFFNGGATISTHSVGAADDLGYRETGAVQVPATTTLITVQTASTNAGDQFYLAFCPSRSVAGAKVGADKSTPIFAAENPAANVPTRLITRGNAAQAIYDMNGTTEVFNRVLLARGVTPLSTTLTALREVEERLRSAGLLPKLLYLNLRCGADNILAARTPFLSRGQFNLDGVPASVTSFTESAGLTGNFNLGTGIIPAILGATRFGNALGVYALNDQASDLNYHFFGNYIGSTSGALPVGYGLKARFANLLLYDPNGGDSGRTSAAWTAGRGNKGTFIGMTDRSGAAQICLNGLVIGSNNNKSTAALPATQILLNTQYVASGGDFIAIDFDPGDAATISYILHDFNKAISRGVTGVEGLY